MARMHPLACLLCVVCPAACAPKTSLDSPRAETPEPSVPAEKPAGPTLSWEKNMLTIHDAQAPGGKVEVWYLEAFCRSGSTDREWAQTVIPHHTRMVEGSSDGKRIQLASEVQGGVEVVHDIRAGDDDVSFRLVATNHGPQRVDVSWAQPCVRVKDFTGRGQDDYIDRCFIYLDGVLTTLDRTRRSEQAIYHGGQVYVPEGIDPKDVNPRPLSPDAPSCGLIGCYSADGMRILATAWEPYQELFQGVIVCIHSDFRLGGLEPGESKEVHGKIYLVDNDPEKLIERYRHDFPD